MNLKELYENISIINVYNKMNLDVEDFIIDSREIKSNSCFIGLKGPNYDGNKYYKKCLEAGSVCAIIESAELSEEDIKYLEENNKTVIVVKDTYKALEDLAAYKRSKLDIPVIAITGSAGKTSTKDIMYSVLNQEINTFKTPGNKNNSIGLPLSILAIKDEKIAVIEMGMNHLGEISLLSKIAKPSIAVITNVGTAHIGNLGSRENILKAKLEILDGLQTNGTVIINNDNDLLNKWAKENQENYNIITYGIVNDSDYNINIIDINEYSSIFETNSIKYETSISGEHYALNSMPAIISANIFNVSDKSVIKGLKEVKLSNNRMDVIKRDGITIINDAYNANFEAMRYSLKYLNEFETRKIAVLGTMKELGNLSDKIHSDLGEEIVKNNIDILITSGEYTENINKKAIENGFNETNSYHLNNNDEVIELINKIKKNDDTILIKASASCNYIDIVNKI